MADPDIGEVPPGWYVLYCNRCPASVCWTADDARTYEAADGDDWYAVVRWAVGQVEHHQHPPRRDTSPAAGAR